MKLRIYQSNTPILEIADIIDLSLDPLSYSGIDYWCQEARTMKCTVPFTKPLKDLIIGTQKELKAGFHTFATALIDDADDTIYIGALKDGDFSINYYSLTHQTIELEFIDFFGLILTLAADRLIYIESETINPINFISTIISNIINPTDQEPDTELYTNQDITDLISKLTIDLIPVISTYNPALWQPYEFIDHLVKDRRQLNRKGAIWTDTEFGLILENDHPHLVFWQQSQTTDFTFHFDYYKYHLHAEYAELIDSLSESSNLPIGISSHIPNRPNVLNTINIDQGHYYIKNKRCLYTGSASIDNILVITSDFKADDLLAEFLKITNAIISTNNNTITIKNRFDTELPIIAINDPIETDISQATSDIPSLSAVAVAHQTAIDTTIDHYKIILSDYPHEVRLKSHLNSPDYKNLALNTPYDLINHRISFDGYTVIPHDIDYDPITLEITITGRARYE